MIQRSPPFRRRPLAFRLPIEFPRSEPEQVPIHMNSLRIPPLVTLIVSSDSVRLNLVAGLFGGAGHHAIRVHSDGVGLKLIWQTAPDLVLVDSALSAAERETLRLRIARCAATTGIPVLEFSEFSFQVSDQVLRVNGYPIPFGQKKCQPARSAARKWVCREKR